jgi:hypothetical protein
MIGLIIILSIIFYPTIYINNPVLTYSLIFYAIFIHKTKVDNIPYNKEWLKNRSIKND